jgi:hypothetical protein
MAPGVELTTEQSPRPSLSWTSCWSPWLRPWSPPTGGGSPSSTRRGPPAVTCCCSPTVTTPCSSRRARMRTCARTRSSPGSSTGRCRRWGARSRSSAPGSLTGRTHRSDPCGCDRKRPGRRRCLWGGLHPLRHPLSRKRSAGAAPPGGRPLVERCEAQPLAATNETKRITINGAPVVRKRSASMRPTSQTAVA